MSLAFWETMYHHNDFISDPTFFSSPQPEQPPLLDIPPPELYSDDFHLPLDSYFDVDAFLDPENIPTPLPFDNPEPYTFHSLKRQRPVAVVEGVAAPAFSAGAGGGSLSAQSVAARLRRRKISEKTRELGKLVPGGARMSTAEMFTAAYKYIQYLQAQVGILEFMANSKRYQGGVESFEGEELGCLLESESIQEKLYAAGKCIVPRKLVQELAGDREVQIVGLKKELNQ